MSHTNHDDDRDVRDFDGDVDAAARAAFQVFGADPELAPDTFDVLKEKIAEAMRPLIEG